MLVQYRLTYTCLKTSARPCDTAVDTIPDDMVSSRLPLIQSCFYRAYCIHCIASMSHSWCLRHMATHWPWRHHSPALPAHQGLWRRLFSGRRYAVYAISLRVNQHLLRQQHNQWHCQREPADTTGFLFEIYPRFHLPSEPLWCTTATTAGVLLPMQLTAQVSTAVAGSHRCMYLEKMLRRGGEGGGDSTGGAAASVVSRPAARRRQNRGDSAWAAARSAGPMPFAIASSAAGAAMSPSLEGSSLEPLERRSADSSSSADAHNNRARISCAAQQYNMQACMQVSHLLHAPPACRSFRPPSGAPLLLRRPWRRPRLGACGDRGLRRPVIFAGCCCDTAVADAGALTTAFAPVASSRRRRVAAVKLIPM